MKLLTKREVAAKIATSTKTVERKVAEGEFPKPIQCAGPRWPEAVVDKWITDQFAKANGDA